MFDLHEGIYNDAQAKMNEILKNNGSEILYQVFSAWKYRLNNKLTFLPGMHVMYLQLNGRYSIEPRAGFRWDINSKQSLNIGFGMHSRMESISTYLAETTNDEGVKSIPNKNTDFVRAMHYVIGYSRELSRFLSFKTEVYYQDLYNIPVERDQLSAFSTLNSSEGIITTPLNNKGTGFNYGTEITLEKRFSSNYYFLATASIFE